VDLGLGVDWSSNEKMLQEINKGLWFHFTILPYKLIEVLDKDTFLSK